MGLLLNAREFHCTSTKRKLKTGGGGGGGGGSIKLLLFRGFGFAADFYMAMKLSLMSVNPTVNFITLLAPRADPDLQLMRGPA